MRSYFVPFYRSYDFGCFARLKWSFGEDLVKLDNNSVNVEPYPQSLKKMWTDIGDVVSYDE